MKRNAFLIATLLVATYCFGLQKPDARAMRIDLDKAVKAIAMRVDLDKVVPGAKKERWISTGRQDSPNLEAEQWITYYNGTPRYYWTFKPAGTQGATKFVKADFPIQYPFWIKKVKHLFYEGTPAWTSNQVKFKIYNTTGDTVIYESPEQTAQKYPAETIFDLGADSVEITAGDFWVSYQPGDTTPTALTDSGDVRNRSFFGQAGSWTPVIPQGQQEARYEFAIQAYVSWMTGAEESEKNAGVEVEYSHNPVKGYGSIFYTIPAKTNVNIKLYDITGRAVATLEDGIKTAGKYEVVLGPELVAGVYFCKFKAGNFNKTKKMVLL